MFFGWFRNTQLNSRNKLEFIGGDLHVIFGYLQVEKVLKNKVDIQKYHWHPHANEKYFYKIDKGNKIIDNDLNALYIPTERIQGIDISRPGYGVFKNDEALVLTKEGYTRSKWKMMVPFDKDIFKITYHKDKAI